MNEKAEDLTIAELCIVFQDRNKQIFGERTTAPKHQPLGKINRRAVSTAQPSSRRQDRKHQQTRKMSKHAVAHKHKEQRSVEETLFQTTQSQISSNSTNRGLQKISQPGRQVVKKSLAYPHHSGKTTKQPQFSRHATNQDQPRNTQQARKVTKPNVGTTHDEESRDRSTTSQLHVPQYTKAGKQRNSQQVVVRRVTKPSLVRQHVFEQRSGGRRETLTRRQWCRRPGLGQGVTAVRVAGDGRVDKIMVTEAATSKGIAIGQNCKSRAVVTLHEEYNKKLVTSYKLQEQAVYTHQKKARDGQVTTTPKSSSRNVIINMNQVKRGRRAAIQHATNDNDISGARRDGLCKQTDPTQQELAFIRVLRKRF